MIAAGLWLPLPNKGTDYGKEAILKTLHEPACAGRGRSPHQSNLDADCGVGSQLPSIAVLVQVKGYKSIFPSTFGASLTENTCIGCAFPTPD
jgi:hypothetical protein